jgi:hypothetical protein
MVNIFGKQIRKQAEILGRSSPDVRYVRLGLLAAIVLSVVSFITTWFGFRGILTFGADDYLLLIVAWIIAFFLTFGVQAILLISVFAFRATKRMTRVRWLATYVIAVFISVGFGYGFYFDVFSAKRLQVENTRKVMRDFLQPLSDFEASYGAFVLGLGRMNTHATKMANLEQTKGGTCGDRSGKNYGPRTQLRLDDAAAFRSYNGRFAAQLAEIRTRIAAIKKINPSSLNGNLFAVGNKLNLQWTELRKIITANTKGGKGLGADLAAFRNFLATTQVNRATVARRVSYKGRTVRQRCPDPFLQTEARAMLTRINSLNVALPKPPQVFNARDRVEVIGLGFYRLIDEVAALPAAVFGFLSVRAVRSAPKRTPPSAGSASGGSLFVLPAGYTMFRIWWFPLLVGAIVDILIFLAAYTSEGRGDVRVERIIGEVINRVNPPRSLRPAMAAALKAFRHGNYIIMPAAWTGPPLHDPNAEDMRRFMEPTPASLVSGVLDVLMAHQLVAYRGQMKADSFLVRKSGLYSGPLNKMVHTPSTKPPKVRKADQAEEYPLYDDDPLGRVTGPTAAPDFGEDEYFHGGHQDQARLNGNGNGNGSNNGGSNGHALNGNGHSKLNGNGMNGHDADDEVIDQPAQPDPAELGTDADVYAVRRRVFEELLYQLQNGPAFLPARDMAREQEEAADMAGRQDANPEDYEVISERRRLEYADGKMPPHGPGQA